MSINNSIAIEADSSAVIIPNTMITIINIILINNRFLSFKLPIRIYIAILI